ncbi:SDR family NAD(P)-dependent oxidoreductase [Lentibacillus sp. CBA3610]|uniref:SDR family NAD(P)-dependent oxidoreductase n=1 Tax=Lentibacillus sp. CBA3610 TaxID=2518176 RepID=UPI001595D1E6|nr:SDR family NAD(P)-dependent oxidoreductase [Lentibacillus sp. CBA3610]
MNSLGRKIGTVMHLNYTSTVLLTQLIYESMKQQKKGAIVNVTSLSVLRVLTADRLCRSKFA